MSESLDAYNERMIAAEARAEAESEAARCVSCSRAPTAYCAECFREALGAYDDTAVDLLRLKAGAGEVIEAARGWLSASDDLRARAGGIPPDLIAMYERVELARDRCRAAMAALGAGEKGGDNP